MRRLVPSGLCVIALLTTQPVNAASCPYPSIAQGAQCILSADAEITDTIWIASGTTLNCKGHRLTSRDPGRLDDPTTGTNNEFIASTPPLAIFIDRAYGTKIQNCVISGFDFGVIVAQSKTADAPAAFAHTKNKILGNTIDVRTNVIDVIHSDNVLISDNRLTYASERGRGVVLDFDSDENEIIGNTIISTDAASTGLVRQLPGAPMVTATAIMDNEIHCLLSDKNVQNFIVSGVLIQVFTNEARSPDAEDSSRTDHNLIEGNDIIDSGVGTSCTTDPLTPCRSDADCNGKGICLLKQNSGVGFNIRAADSVVRGNRISGRMDRGVSFGGVGVAFTSVGWFPGHCAADSSRICSGASDCNIPGYDSASVGPCLGAITATLNGNTTDLVAENNTLSGVYDSAAMQAGNTDRFVFRGNNVHGGVSGIRINGTALNGLIDRNSVTAASNALYLAFQANLKLQVRLNDFTAYGVAIRTSNDFVTPAEISGNYWGVPCPGFPTNLVRFDSGGVNGNVADSHPYGEPVAATPDASLTPPCQ